jgi:hypothetical protein
MFVLFPWFSCFVLVCMIELTRSYPQYLTCSDTIAPGQNIMTGPAVSSTTCSVVVSRGSTPLSSGSVYVAGETLTVSVSSCSEAVHYIFQTTNAVFTDGSCSDTRSPVTQSSSLVMPTGGSVTIIVAWAPSYGTVRISDSFTMVADANESPVSTPTQSPGASSSSATSDSSRRSLHLGVVMGIGIPLLAAMMLPAVTTEKVIGLYSITSVCLAVVVVALTLAWASNNDAASTTSLSSSHFLGRPNWNSSVFPYHPLLMVAGFYFTVVLASLSKTVLSNAMSWVAQLLCFSAASACLVVGIMAIVKYKHDSETPSLTTLHSWIAIICVGCFACTICSKFVVVSERNNENIRLSSNLPLVQLALELLTLGTLTLTILTGLTMQLGQCSYVDLASFGTDSNPAKHYPHLPTACKIGFGMGICVITTSLLVATVTIYRTQWSVTYVPMKSNIPSQAAPTPSTSVPAGPPPAMTLSDP